MSVYTVIISLQYVIPSLKSYFTHCNCDIQLITIITLASYAIYDLILETYQLVTFSILRNTDFKETVCRYQSHTITSIHSLQNHYQRYIVLQEFTEFMIKKHESIMRSET